MQAEAPVASLNTGKTTTATNTVTPEAANAAAAFIDSMENLFTSQEAVLV